MAARHGIQSCNLLRWRVFYLPMVQLGHIPCRHMVKEYEGFLCTLDSSLTRHTSQTILTQCQPLFLQSNSHKGSHEEVPYLVHNPITFTLHKRSPRVSLKWSRGQINDFPIDDFMPFKPSIIKPTIYTRSIPLQISTSRIV